MKGSLEKETGILDKYCLIAGACSDKNERKEQTRPSTEDAFDSDELPLDSTDSRRKPNVDNMAVSLDTPQKYHATERNDEDFEHDSVMFTFKGFTYNRYCLPVEHYYTGYDKAPVIESCRSYWTSSITGNILSIQNHECPDQHVYDAQIQDCVEVDEFPGDCHKQTICRNEPFRPGFVLKSVMDDGGKMVSKVSQSRRKRFAQGLVLDSPRVTSDRIELYSNGSFAFKGHFFDEYCQPLTYRKDKAPHPENCAFFYKFFRRHGKAGVFDCKTGHFDAETGECSSKSAPLNCKRLLNCKISDV